MIIRKRDRRNQLILIVDADKVSVKMTFTALKGFIGQNSFRVEQAENALEVHCAIQQERDYYGRYPALILIDPRVQGLKQADLVSELKEQYPSIPKVLCTSAANRRIHKESLDKKDLLFWLPRPWDGLYQAEMIRETLGIYQDESLTY